ESERLAVGTAVSPGVIRLTGASVSVMLGAGTSGFRECDCFLEVLEQALPTPYRRFRHRLTHEKGRNQIENARARIPSPGRVYDERRNHKKNDGPPDPF